MKKNCSDETTIIGALLFYTVTGVPYIIDKVMENGNVWET
jgi:hypothetical protein